MVMKNQFNRAIIFGSNFGFNTHYPGDFNGWFSWGSMIGDLNAAGSFFSKK